MAEFEDRQFYQYPPFNPIIPAPVWGKDAEYAVPVVSSVGNGPAGPKGEDGGYIPFDELTDEQLEKIYMGASACHTYSTDAYVLTTGTQTQRITIPIENISEYDLLCVDVEGLDLVEDTDYTFMDDYIVLNQPITHPNTRVHFKAISYQLADGDRNMNVTRVVNEVKPMFANPVEYAGTSTYPAMTIVKYNGAYYVSKKAVPVWTAPDNAEFWQLTFLYDDIIAVDAGGTGADNAEDARENLGITPANIGAATQEDMSQAQEDIGALETATEYISGGTLSELGVTYTLKSGFTLINSYGRRFGKLVVAIITIKKDQQMSPGTTYHIMESVNLMPAAAIADHGSGQIPGSQNLWFGVTISIPANLAFDICLIGILP